MALDDLSPEDLALLHSQFRAGLAKTDPIYKLHHTLYGDPELRRDYEAIGRKGVKKGLFPGATLQDDPREVAAEAVKPALDSVAELKKEIDADRRERRLQGFRQQTIDAGADPADVDEIHKFMLENEISDKGLRIGVDAFYRTKETATPNATEGYGLVFDAPGATAADDNPFLKQILGAGPGDDLTDLTMRLAEKTFGEATRPASGRRG